MCSICQVFTIFSSKYLTFVFHGHSHKEILNLLNNIQLQVRQNTLLLKQLLQKQKTAEVLVTSSNDLSLPLTTEHSLEEYEKSLK